jgi:hypothetical protein
MKKLLVILLFIPYILQAQTPVKVRGELQQIYKVGSANDTTTIKLSGDSALFNTTQSRFKFNKPVYAPLIFSGSDTLATKPYARSLVNEVDPVWTAASGYYTTLAALTDSLNARGTGGSIIYANNGLTKDGNVIKLGGRALGDIQIVGNIGGGANGLTLGDENTGSIDSAWNSVNIHVTNGTTLVKSTFDFSGLHYDNISYPDTTLSTPNHLMPKNWTLDQINAKASQWTTTSKGIKYDGGGDSICIDNDGGIRVYDGILLTYKITDWGLTCDNNPFLNLYRNSDLTISATQNIWYKITGFTVKGGNQFIIQGDSVQFQHTGFYNVNFTMSFSGLNDEVWEFGVFRGGTLEEPSQMEYTGTSNIGNASCSVQISATALEWISFKIRNITDNDDPTIKRFSANILTNQIAP